MEALFPTAAGVFVDAVWGNWDYAIERGIDTALRTRMFLASIAVETGGLRSIDENLNYSTAARLMAVWPSHFKSEAAAQPFLRNPEKLANSVYANRLGNGPPDTGDGYRYRGGGFIQCTGRETYRLVGYEDDPDALRQPVPGFRTAVVWWASTGCNEVADRDDPGMMRRKVNASSRGLAVFQMYLEKARKILA